MTSCRVRSASSRCQATFRSASACCSSAASTIACAFSCASRMMPRALRFASSLISSAARPAVCGLRRSAPRLHPRLRRRSQPPAPSPPRRSNGLHVGPALGRARHRAQQPPRAGQALARQDFRRRGAARALACVPPCAVRVPAGACRAPAQPGRPERRRPELPRYLRLQGSWSRHPACYPVSTHDRRCPWRITSSHRTDRSPFIPANSAGPAAVVSQIRSLAIELPRDAEGEEKGRHEPAAAGEGIFCGARA